MNPQDLLAKFGAESTEALRAYAMHMKHLNTIWLHITIPITILSIAVFIWGLIQSRNGNDGLSPILVGTLLILIFGVTTGALLSDNYIISRAPEVWAFSQLFGN